MKAQPTPVRTKTKRILVAEDDPSVSDIVARALQAAGYRVEVVTDGIAALNFVLEERPDGVVLDLVLPRLAGYEVCGLIRKSPTVHQTPIIIMSGIGTDDSKLRAFETGADDYVVKPFRFEELVARVDAVLRRAALTTPPTPFFAPAAA
jgi:DNA-binding response OmpR family regulator